MATGRAERSLRCLIVDYGGVLTTSVGEAFDAWAAADGLDRAALVTVMRQFVSDDALDNASHALERGEIGPAEFERRLAALLRRADGGEVAPAGLLSRMFRGMAPESRMTRIVRRAREQGLATALLSNSWGLDYDRADWDGLFDAVVISGEVRLRKPEPEIYRLAAERLGARPDECVFVDDLPVNVRGAVAVGMVGVHHTDVDRTVEELEALFDVPLT